MERSIARPGVSVVIPAYNYAKYLPASIDSVLKQDYPVFEVIVVNDGSTDNTAQVLAQYGDKIRCITQKNAGLPAARNTGIKAARYDYVGFLDADDAWLPSFLSATMEAFARLPAEYAVVATQLSYIDPNGAPLELKNILPAVDREITCRDMVLQSRFVPSTVVAKKSVFDEVGLFDETLRSTEDRDMWIRIAVKRRVFRIGQRLLLARRHPANMSKNADRMKESGGIVIRKAYDQGLIPRSDWLFWRQVYSYHYFQSSWRLRDQGRYREAVQDLSKSLILWPWFVRSNLMNEPFLFRVRGMIGFFCEALGFKKR
jgi:glycosyltransferase involved in cell wall biosynthesis